MVSYHLYPAGWGINDGNDTAIYIRRHEEIARDAGKVAYFGEYGKRAADQSPGGCNLAPGRAFDAQRAQVYQAWLGYSAIEQAASGVMVWQLINDGKDDCEGFQVYCPPDSATCEYLRQASMWISAAPVVMSAATFVAVRLAPGSIATLFGAGLDNARVVLADAKGSTYDARVFFSGPGQINFKVPDNLPVGGAVVRVVRDGVTQNSAGAVIGEVEPGLFTAAADGKGLAAGIATIVAGEGSRQTQFLARYEGGQWVGIPVAVPAGGSAVLSLFGTGIRNSTRVSAKVKGVAADVLYSGAQGEFDGLDQVNVLLPAGLAGSGEVDVELTVAGKASNVVRVVLE